MKESNLPEKVQYDIYLSESYTSAEGKYGDETPTPDLEATVHVYDFRMTLDEVLGYIEYEKLPERFEPYGNDVRNYALVANGITYMQRIGDNEKYKEPANISTVSEYLEMMLDRGVFVDLLSDKEACDMTMAQFSRDDVLIYQGREEGIKAFIRDKVEDGVAESIIVSKLRKHFTLDEKTAIQYCKTYAK